MINRRWLLLAGSCLIFWVSPAAAAPQPDSSAAEIILDLGGTPPAFAYISTLLTRSLALRQHVVRVRNRGDIPTTRLEVMLQSGEISAFILGPTASRNQRFLPIQVGMTDGLVNRRILFIPHGSQPVYDQVETLEDFQRLGKVAGLGEAWSDRDIWAANHLPMITIGGDWKRLYQMVASQNRGVDYLPRGAHEMAVEWPAHPELQIERNLVLVYDQDHIMYVSPAAPELHALLQEVLVEARDSGLIAELAGDFFAAAFKPPVNMTQRRVIPLSLPASSEATGPANSDQ